MSKPIIAMTESKPMKLTRVERERISDSRVKIESITKSLKHVDPGKIRAFEEIQDCLEDAEQNLGEALRSPDPDRPQSAPKKGPPH